MTAESTGFLYPFLEADERDTSALLATLARSAAEKVVESWALRRSVVERYGEELERTAADLAARLDQGGSILAMGNGGSATDADGLVALFTDPPAGPPAAGQSMVAEAAVLTALANDVGFESVFARQLIARARPDDVLIGFSTSGDSPNLLRAFEVAAAKGMVTVGFAGYDGGAMAASSSVDHCMVVPSESVHRVQEAQDALVWALWSSVQGLRCRTGGSRR